MSSASTASDDTRADHHQLVDAPEGQSQVPEQGTKLPVPDLFRRVIAYSTTLVAQQDDDAPEKAMFPDGAWDYHSDLGVIANTAELKPVRMMINANSMDNGYNAAESGKHNWLMANQRTAAALKSKGYHYRFVLGQGLGHCAREVEQATMAESLLWVWRGYPNPP